MSKKIRLMTDYGCDPLWWDEDDLVGDIELETLPLSENTIKRLHQWANIYDTTLDWDDPSNSPGFGSQESEYIFEQEGINLWKQVQYELYPNYQVVYFSYILKKVVNSPDDLVQLVGWVKRSAKPNQRLDLIPKKYGA